MKKVFLPFISFILLISALTLRAQVDMTNLITNPSFEANVDDLAEGWTYEGGADTLTWHAINTDGDETKDGNNICGLWNDVFADPAITQTITDVENGIYKVTADLMCSRNAESLRLTTQRIFINNKSVLFGVKADSNYSKDDLAILTDELGETITFADHVVSPVGKENGPFHTCEVIDTITDGTIKLGIKTNGSGSQYDFTFPLLTAGNGWGWFKVDNFTLTKLEDNGGSAISDIQTDNNDLKIFVNDGYIIVEGVPDFRVYSINGSLVSSDSQLEPGIYIVQANNKVAKVIIPVY
jgi:hypothetical protein